MKLRNKLIPLASIAATATIAMPIALTSCANVEGFVNILEGYIPSIKKATQPTKTQEADANVINTYYMSQIHRNPEILKQDLLWTSYMNTITLEGKGHVEEESGWAKEEANLTSKTIVIVDTYLEYSKYDVKVSNVSNKLYEIKKDTDVWTVSFDLTINYSAEANVNVEEKAAYIGGKDANSADLEQIKEIYSFGAQYDIENVSETISLKNIPFVLVSPEETYYYGYDSNPRMTNWILSVDGDTLFGDDDFNKIVPWSISIDYSRDMQSTISVGGSESTTNIVDSESYTYDRNWEPDFDVDPMEWDDKTALFAGCISEDTNIYSYHLKDIARIDQEGEK